MRPRTFILSLMLALLLMGCAQRPSPAARMEEWRFKNHPILSDDDLDRSLGIWIDPATGRMWRVLPAYVATAPEPEPVRPAVIRSEIRTRFVPVQHEGGAQ